MGCTIGLGFCARVLAEEVVLVGGCKRGVAVRRTDHAKLEGIDAKLLLELEAKRWLGLFEQFAGVG